MLQAALPNGFRLRMLPRSVPAVFRQTGEIFYIGGTDVLPAPLEGQEEADAIAGLSDPENETARSELIEHNLRLVVYIAQKFDNTGVGVEDLISIGTIGLIKAINTFNPEKKIKLATYASRCIENEILMYLRRNNKTRMEVSIDEPLNVDWDGNELLLSDILGTEEDVIYQGLEQEAEHRVLGSAISKLSEREQVIVKLRFGINMPEGREKTQKEVADLLGISQSYISRLEKRIMKRLRKEIARYEWSIKMPCPEEKPLFWSRAGHDLLLVLRNDRFIVFQNGIRCRRAEQEKQKNRRLKKVLYRSRVLSPQQTPVGSLHRQVWKKPSAVHPKD